jgi:hypothetical protein
MVVLVHNRTINKMSLLDDLDRLNKTFNNIFTFWIEAFIAHDIYHF